ncbi:MAG: DeoR/GlpR transcriptional regulator [Oscillospiraceae bacterium]|nr:DeoR/GlpR transcriptional regulator [Oscillospiraceae bacterium]
MLAVERQSVIMEMLEKHKVVKISDIANRFGVSNETARRDLDVLQDSHHVKRIYGGAILQEDSSAAEPQHKIRSAKRHTQKVSIGRAAAALVNSGETIILDIGTTTLEIARHLKGLSDITVLSNSLPIINELSNSSVNLYCLGGKVNTDELSMSGKIAEDSLQKFFVDRAFIGAGGVTLEGGISDYNSEEAVVRQAIIQRANQVVLVADSGKFGSNAFASVCGLEQVDVVVSDENLPIDFQEALSKFSNLRLILASPDDEDDDSAED